VDLQTNAKVAKSARIADADVKNINKKALVF
jgi:hypothetical protein